MRVHEQGSEDPFALIVARPSQNRPDVLAAFGWRLTGPLSYIAGLNEKHAEVAPCEAATTSGAEALREAVRREIRALSLARRVVHSSARHFAPVMLNSDHNRDPIGWTFIVGTGDHRTHRGVTARGHVAVTDHDTRADATRWTRQAHTLEACRTEADQQDAARLRELPADELARTLLRVRNGGVCELFGPSLR